MHVIMILVNAKVAKVSVLEKAPNKAIAKTYHFILRGRRVNITLVHRSQVVILHLCSKIEESQPTWTVSKPLREYFHLT